MKTVLRVAWKELVLVLRDRRLIFSTLVFPVLLMPLLVFGPSLVQERLLKGAQEGVQEVAVAGLDGGALEALRGAGLAPRPHPNPRAAVEEGAYPAGVEGRGGGYRVYGRLSGGLTASQVAVGKVREALGGLKEALAVEALRARGVDPRVLEPFRVEVVDASPKRERASGLLGFIFPVFLVLFILSGGQAVAVDATAGEKEKGTLEALLAAPIPLFHLALGKTLAAVGLALLSGASGLLGLVLGGALAARLGTGPLGEEGLRLGGQVVLDAQGFLGLFLSAFLLALFMGAVMVALGLYARSFKEAQSYMVPLQLLGILPLVFLQFKGFLDLEAWYHLLPVLNVALLMDALLKGSATPLQAGLAWGSTLVYAALALLLALWSFAREEVVFRN